MNKKIPVSFRSQGKKINININFVLKDLFENLSLDVELINETQVVEIQQDQILLSEFCYKIPEFLWSLDDWILIYKDSGGVESICVGDYMIWAHVWGRSNHLDHLLKKLNKNIQNIELSWFQKDQRFEFLHEFNNLNGLILGQWFELSSLDDLKNLPNLRFLKIESLGKLENFGIENNKLLDTIIIHDCDKISQLPLTSNENKITSLKIFSCKNLFSIEGIEKFESLLKLTLFELNIKNLDGICELKNLELLDIRKSIQIESFDFLAHLKKLKILAIGTNAYPFYVKRNEFIKNLSNLNFLNENTNLSKLIAQGLENVTNINALLNLNKLKLVNLDGCKSLKDAQVLSKLNDLEYLSIRECSSLRELPIFPEKSKIKKIEAEECLRINSLEPLRGATNLIEINGLNPEHAAELLANASYKRHDINYIQNNLCQWIKIFIEISQDELFHEKFAISLAKAFSLLKNSSSLDDFEKHIINCNRLTSAPWKAWFGGTLKESGFELYCQRVGRVPIAKMAAGAIGGVCITLPHTEHHDWSRQWLLALESTRLHDAKSLQSIAPEICLAYARAGFTESLYRWLEVFTDPSDPGALDSVHAALAKFELISDKPKAAEAHIFAIKTPRLRDPVLADLISFYTASNADLASAHLLLIDTPLIRRELAKTLVVLPEFAKSEIALHRLVVAMGDSPVALGELISLLPVSSSPSKLIQKISESLQLDRKETLRKIAEEFHRAADRLLME
jgi:hypothetical protein